MYVVVDKRKGTGLLENVDKNEGIGGSEIRIKTLSGLPSLGEKGKLEE